VTKAAAAAHNNHFFPQLVRTHPTINGALRISSAAACLSRDYRAPRWIAKIDERKVSALLDGMPRQFLQITPRNLPVVHLLLVSGAGESPAPCAVI
jgi:hypothetical protein